jgi:branched-chain amino acid transport system ATP-binding protein
MDSAPAVVLEARGLVKEFHGFRAVSDLDLQIREGQIHGLIGPNGAGKTTVFNLLTKAITPTAGQILLRGRDITGFPPARVARLGIVRSFQISAVFPHLSVLQNVRVALQRPRHLATQWWLSRNVLERLDDDAEALLDAVQLSDWKDKAAAELPYGRKRALEIATTLALDPDLLLLDEPMAGLGLEDIHQITDLIRRVAAGKTVLLVEHNLSVVAKLCDRVTVLTRGARLSEGSYAEVNADPLVREAYLGAGHA